MDYKARFYSPYLNHFTQPDTIVPDLNNPQALNRYSYALNNPIKYTDPSGHRPIIDNDKNGNPIVDTSWRPGIRHIDEDNDDNSTYHLQSDTNLYLLGWENFGSAWSIYTNPNATILQRAGAGYYMGAWGGFHLVGAVGAAGIVCGLTPACAGTVEGLLGIGGTAQTANMACGGDMCASETTYIRYMVEEELRAVHQTGYLRGGNPGVTYFTTDIFETVGGATSRLALDTIPRVGVQFQIINNPSIIGPEIVESLTGRLGMGVQFWTSDPVQVTIMSIRDLIQ